MMDLSRFPRIQLGHWPTPLEPLANLTALLGGPRLWIKRDDCTGLSTGGNKTRKLEFLLAEAAALRADVVITQGATQSNHARQTAAGAAKLGMKCHILLEDRTGSTDPDYTHNGNVLLDRLHGATVEHRAGGSDMQREMELVAEHLPAHWYKFCALAKVWARSAQLDAAGPQLRSIAPPPLEGQPTGRVAGGAAPETRTVAGPAVD